MELFNYLQGVWNVSPPVLIIEVDLALTGGFVVFDGLAGFDVELEAGENNDMINESITVNIFIFFN